MNIKDFFKKFSCCGLGKKFCKTEGACDSSMKKCCPCRCVLKIVALFLVLFVANTYLGFSNMAIDRYIQKNPKKIIESVENMIKNERGQKNQESKKKAVEVAEKIKENNYPFIGNRNGNKVVVEFFDYNCGYCKKQNAEIDSLVKKDTDVKVVMVNLPIMSEASFFAAQAAVATFNHFPDKFEELNNQLFSAKLENSDSVIKIVEKVLKQDAAVVKKAMTSKEVEEHINKNYEYMKETGIQGTPAFVIGKEFVPGYSTASEIEALLKK